MRSSLARMSALFWRVFSVSSRVTADEQLLRLRERLSRLRSLSLLGGASLSSDLKRLQKQIEQLEAAPTLTGEEIWHSVELARHEDRPYTLDYVERLLEDWFELHGDRGRADDPAIVAGLGRFNGRTVVLVGHQKGRDIKERKYRNFGMSHPEGYRKAMRAMELAERHRFPVVALIDTPGAWPGVAAEQHGQGGALARSHALMARLTVPIVSCIIGEGGSGGASALAVADRVLMQQHAIYSVISPEGCAAILWRDATQAQKAAEAFKPDAAHCLELGVVDVIVPEPLGGAHLDHDGAAKLLGESLEEALAEIEPEPGPALRRSRRAKFRAMGVYA
jgi:acetyl-CoA carboxylase carboxyl transferase subunit alpha